MSSLSSRLCEIVANLFLYLPLASSRGTSNAMYLLIPFSLSFFANRSSSSVGYDDRSKMGPDPENSNIAFMHFSFSLHSSKTPPDHNTYFKPRTTSPGSPHRALLLIFYSHRFSASQHLRHVLQLAPGGLDVLRIAFC